MKCKFTLFVLITFWLPMYVTKAAVVGYGLCEYDGMTYERVACDADLFYSDYNDGNASEYCSDGADMSYSPCIDGEDSNYVYLCVPDLGAEYTCEYCGFGSYYEATQQDWFTETEDDDYNSVVIYKGLFDGNLQQSDYYCRGTINSELTYEYACGAGYYQSGGSGENIQCTLCPKTCGQDGACTEGTNEDGDNSITTCTVPAGSGFVDNTGGGHFTSECSYSN